MTPAAATEERPGDGRRTVALSTTLAALIGGLVLVAVAAVLAISWSASRTDTLELLTDKAVLAIELTEARLRANLDPARDKLELIGRMIEAGELDPADHDRLGDLMTSAIASAPQVRTLAYIDPQAQLFTVIRVAGHTMRTLSIDGTDNAGIREALAQTGERRRAYWGDIVYIDQRQHSALNLRRPVRIDGRFAGMLVAIVAVADLSERLQARTMGDDIVTFVLHGPIRVLAHPNMKEALPLLSPAEPLPALDQVGDPVLAALWQGDRGKEQVEEEPQVRVSAPSGRPKGSAWCSTAPSSATAACR